MKKLSCLILGMALSYTPFVASSDQGRGREWEKTHLIWNFALATSCDVMPLKHPDEYFHLVDQDVKLSFKAKDYSGIRRGDTVWIQSRLLSQFCQEVLPKITVPFVLVLNDGDECFPSDVLGFTAIPKNSFVAKRKLNAELEKLLNDDRIIAIFAQNCDYDGSNPKVHQIPIGIDFHSVAYRRPKGFWGIDQRSPSEQERYLEEFVQKSPPTYARKMRAFVDFQLNDSMNRRYSLGEYKENRKQVFERVIKSGMVDYSKNPISRDQLWAIKTQYAFSISPHGEGLDCHRTWEDLALGCIVIVKTSILDPLYEGLPVVIVKDWSEVTEPNMKLWLKKFGDASFNPDYRERLTNEYWWAKIQSAAQPYK